MKALSRCHSCHNWAETADLRPVFDGLMFKACDSCRAAIAAEQKKLNEELLRERGFIRKEQGT